MGSEAWEGMDCVNAVDSAWATPLDGGTVDGDWFEWRLEADDPGYGNPMRPYEMRITPIPGRDTVWYDAHNPAYLRVIGILPDETYDDANPILELDPITPRWSDGNMRTLTLSTTTAYIGFRIYVRSWNSVNVDVTDNHTGWTELKMLGRAIGDIPLAKNPDGSQTLNPDGSNTVNPGGF